MLVMKGEPSWAKQDVAQKVLRATNNKANQRILPKIAIQTSLKLSDKVKLDQLYLKTT